MSTSNKPKVLTWKILPNTGHHYFFIPFGKEITDQLPGGSRGELAKKCRASKTTWQRYSTEAPWIRWRFGFKGKKSNIGIWVAVESNFGDIKRGTLHDKREIVAADMPEEGKREISLYRSVNTEALKYDKDGQSQSFDVSVPLGGGKELPLAVLQIIWQVPNGAPIDVDLVVDFGNTRSVVLALENNSSMVQNSKLNAVCRNIYILPRGNEYPDPDDKETLESLDAITDSWFMLQEPQFSEWDYPSYDGVDTPFCTSKMYEVEEKTELVEEKVIFVTKKVEKKTFHYWLTERVPQMFVEISPAFMGAEAKESYRNVDLTPGLNICLSSPKRYLWDRGLLGREGGQLPWHMNPNPWNEHIPVNDQFKLRGQICRYLNADGSSWSFENPPFQDPNPMTRPHCFPKNPCYPRCSAMVWSALSLLENAYRQITSINWRKGNNEFTNRRLRSVHVTFPSGWIAKEKNYYREAWQTAVDIFTLSHMKNHDYFQNSDKHADELGENCDGRPLLKVELDEAVASQLPFIYSEVGRLNNANLWIHLYGRKDNPKDDSHNSWRVRVMTVDIGGGTCDSSIVEYRNDVGGSSIALRYDVLFKDCSSFAGDAVTKRIIEQVLLPSILKAKGIDDESDESGRFSELLRGPRTSASDKARWQRITSQLFLPVVRQWLTDVAAFPSGIYHDEEEGDFRKIECCNVEQTALNDFNDYLTKFGVGFELDSGDRLPYDPKLINACIAEELEGGLAPLGKYIVAYDVDVVTLSGKISEMPIVYETLCKHVPLRNQRVIRMKDYLAGDWYPMAKNGKIVDAKSVTAIGAALYAATDSGLLGADWAIRPDPLAKASRTRNYWGVMNRKGEKGFNGEPILTPEEEDNSSKVVTKLDGSTYNGREMMIEEYIGRQKYYSSQSVPEQQYQLHWTGDKADAPKSPLIVRLRRVSEEEEDEDDIELEDIEFTDPNEAERLDKSKIELLLNTLPKEGFWMEEACFEVKL